MPITIETNFGRVKNEARNTITSKGRSTAFNGHFRAGLLHLQSTGKSRGEAFKQYETIIRWSQWDAAADFISPEYQAEHPITRLDLDRLRLFKVTSYTLRSAGVFDEGMTATQVVEIKMFNSYQAVERTIIDEQKWRYDEESKRWLLHSGLPDPTQRY
jgi:hypothetical protein